MKNKAKSTEPEVRLILGDSAKAPSLAPDLVGKVALAVTSPPYHNAISYNSHAVDSSVNYRTRDTLSYSIDYLPLLDRVWTACYEMLRPGGFLAVNVGTVLLDGYHFPLPQDIMSRLDRSIDTWEFYRVILWNKVTAGVKRAGSVIQHRLPGYWYPNIMTEHIIVVRKPGADFIASNDVPPEWWLPVWDLAAVAPKQVDHPAPFPEDLPHRLILMLTKSGDFVMDPFNGAGSTTKAALDLGRNSIGFDILQDYIRTARERTYKSSLVRSRQLRIEVIPEDEFIPGPNRGRTRHGAGLATRRK